MATAWSTATSASGWDVYGNYSNSSFDGSGCSLPSWPGWSGGAVADQVTVRGPGNGTTGYCLLNSTLATDDGGAVALQGSTTETNDAGRASAPVPVEVAINPGNTAITTASGLTVAAGDYEIAFTPIGGSWETLSGALPTTANGNPERAVSLLVDRLHHRVALSAGPRVGGLDLVATTDIHEVNNVTTQSITTTEVPVFDASLSKQPQQRPARPGPDLYSGVKHRLERQCRVGPDHGHRRLPERRDAIASGPMWVAPAGPAGSPGRR